MRPGTLLMLCQGMIAFGIACGHRETESHVADDGHAHAQQAMPGVSFAEGQGMILPEETRTLLGLTLAKAEVRRLPDYVPVMLQIFDGKHRRLPGLAGRAGSDAQGSGFIGLDAAAKVRAGQKVEFLTATNLSPGVVLAAQRAVPLGESEVVVNAANAAGVLKPGEFLSARICLPGEAAVVAVPRSALLRTSEGAFVYRLQGGAFVRLGVTAGSDADGWVEIARGVAAGDEVVTAPVQTLWLAELRATRGGGHSH